MRGAAPIVLLTLLLAALIFAHWLILPDPARRNYEFLPGMVESVALDAQSPAPLLEDGTRLDLRPPDGTIARAHLPFEFDATPEGAVLAGKRLTDPLGNVGPEARPDAGPGAGSGAGTDDGARGAFVFATFCSVCHGVGGLGDGPVTSRGVPPPPSLLLPHAVDMPDGQMFHVITLGQGNMASYAAQVEREDRWRVIRHIRTLQGAGVEAVLARRSQPQPAHPQQVPQ